MKFIVTKELGRLARWLRIAGFDTVYYKKDTIGTLIIQALRDERVIITRKKERIDDLEKNTLVVRSEILREQLKEVFTRLALEIAEDTMFSRCTLCNDILKEVSKEVIKDIVPGYVFAHHDFFMQCPACKKIYWRGSHWGNVSKIIHELTTDGYR